MILEAVLLQQYHIGVLLPHEVDFLYELRGHVDVLQHRYGRML